MQSTVNLKSNRTPITTPCVPAHRRDWMDDTDEELYRLKASKPHCNNHPCRSGCLQQWFQQFPQLFSRCSIKIADYHFKLAVWAFCKLKTATNPAIKIKSTFLTILCFQRKNVLVFIFLLKKGEQRHKTRLYLPLVPSLLVLSLCGLTQSMHTIAGWLIDLPEIMLAGLIQRTLSQC